MVVSLQPLVADPARPTQVYKPLPCLSEEILIQLCTEPLFPLPHTTNMLHRPTETVRDIFPWTPKSAHAAKANAICELSHPNHI